jgi:N-acetylglucosamine-6-sulfatase
MGSSTSGRDLSTMGSNAFTSLSTVGRSFNGTVYVEDMAKASEIPFGTYYQTAQIGNRSLAWLESLRKDPVLREKPFFAYLGPHAPHFPAQPAPWHEHAFDDVRIPETINYNISSPDKAQHIRQNPPLNALAKCWQDQHFRDRWASLLSVDDLVAAVLDFLEREKLMETTFLFYTSDHGYKQGQWRIPTSKQHPYETDIRVPMLVRGPGVPANAVFEQLAANVDVAPTILDLAGLQPNFMDGRSMLPWLLPSQPESAAPWRDIMLHEYLAVGTYYNDHSEIWNDGTTAAKCGGELPRGPSGSGPEVCEEAEGLGEGQCWFVDSEHSNSWRALRVLQPGANLMYIEYDPSWRFQGKLQHYELYDIAKDPYQLHNIYSQADAGLLKKLEAALARYYKCFGTFDSPSDCVGVDVAGESFSLNDELIV